jgi:hypothetical protein
MKTLLPKAQIPLEFEIAFEIYFDLGTFYFEFSIGRSTYLFCPAAKVVVNIVTSDPR